MRDKVIKIINSGDSLKYLPHVNLRKNRFLKFKLDSGQP